MTRYRKTSRRNKPARTKPVRRLEHMRPQYLKRSELPWWADLVVIKIARRIR